MRSTPAESDRGALAHRPVSTALLSFILATGSWTVILLTSAWVASRPPGTFNDQGGMVITFAVLPLMLLCWIMGGVIAMFAGHRALKQIRSGARAAGERPLAQVGVILGWALTLGGPGMVIWRMAIE